MDHETFRKHAHDFVDWMADYMGSIEKYPVRSQAIPGDIATQLPIQPPEVGEPMEKIFADFKSIVLPGMTHWQHPDFFAYFSSNASPPSVLAEMLTATLGAQCMLWQTSPAATEMEIRILDWLRIMTGLPKGLYGVIQDSASSAILCALLTARERATDWQVNHNGLAQSAPVIVYTSEQAHSATEKGAKIAGYGKSNVRFIKTDNNFAMDPHALETAIQKDQSKGLIPACVVASIGTTGVGAIDPLRKIGEICKSHNVFLHVDAAWAGSALILPEQRWMSDGIELADSIVFNPHKWLMTNFDCSAHYIRDPDALTRTLAILPEYLKSSQKKSVINYRDWGIPLGRRFRALKLWFVIRSYGIEGLRKVLRQHIELAKKAESWIAVTPDFEIVAPRSLTLFNFRYRPKGVFTAHELDKINEILLQRLNDSGSVYFTQNRVLNCYTIRWSTGQFRTEFHHVKAAWELICKTARDIKLPSSKI